MKNGVLLQALWLSVFIGNLPAAPALQIKVLSGKPEMVSGGSALVEISGPALEGAKVALNKQNVTKMFRPGQTGGTLVGRVEGLKLGANAMEVIAGGKRAQLQLVNHPIGGPVFSGPHQQPFVCQTETAGLGKPVDSDCNVAKRVQYFYKSTKRVAAGGFGPGFVALDAATTELPADVATTTTTDGQSVKFVVRVETGTINRGIYRIAFLHQPGQPLPDPWTKVPGWNGRLVYSFGGGAKTGFRQGNAPPAVNLGDLAVGYAVASSTLDVFGTNANDVINAETLMMVKEHFIKTFGVPMQTIGTGGSGGSIQQYLIAQNYPGLLDGIIPSMSFPDMTTITEPIVDCVLISRVAEKMGPALSEEQRLAVAGYGAWGVCKSRAGSAQWVEASACDSSMPKEKVYSAATNPKGVRCSLNDNQANIFGKDSRGASPQFFDNTGVQYGLRAFNEGKISAEQFLDLNERIGGFDGDGSPSASRAVGDRGALRTAYQTGRVVSGGGGLGSIPIIDFRRYGDLDGNPHDRVRSMEIRKRLERANGSSANQVLLTNPAPGFNAVRLMDRWLDRIAADPAAGSTLEKVARNKPEELVDACWGPNNEKIADEGRCNEIYPAFTDPRMVAGGPLIGDILKCSLKPVDAKDYKQQLSDAQMTRLKSIFPAGTCDYNKPGVEQGPLSKTWISYGDK